MSAAAYSSPCDRMSDWLEELERTLKAFDGLSCAAQDAVKAVIESFVHDPDTSGAEIARLSVLLERHSQHSEKPRQQGRSSFSQKGTQHSQRIAVALFQRS